MKKVMKDTCILSALMIICVFAVSVIWSGFTAEILLVFELFLLAFIISVTLFLTDEWTSLPIAADYIVKFFAVSGIVMLFGFVAGWFYPSNFWMVFIYVGAVFAAAYFLDSIKTKRDVEFINEQILSRQSRQTDDEK
ncbi:MAG: DUF3021 family protein [Oscillospiraceae bacterium]|nr:DUF3021 family protein [Oscillospiraceae bacterium]